jgi:hypothetical protein
MRGRSGASCNIRLEDIECVHTTWGPLPLAALSLAALSLEALSVAALPMAALSLEALPLAALPVAACMTKCVKVLQSKSKSRKHGPITSSDQTVPTGSDPNPSL